MQNNTQYIINSQEHILKNASDYSFDVELHINDHILAKKLSIV
jgi:hypothetical protein